MFSFKFINSPFEDSALYVRQANSKNHLLFDMGDLRKASISDLIKLRWIFISHTHIDHFFGFHYFLRCALKAKNKVTSIFGPPGITQNVYGALSSYLWNLLDNYNILFEIHEVFEDKIIRYNLHSKNYFKPCKVEECKHDNVILNQAFFRVKIAFLDHKTPVLGFRLEEKERFAVNKDALNKQNVQPGKWIDKVKNLLLENEFSDQKIEIEDGLEKDLQSLKKDFFIKKQFPAHAYITDFNLTKENEKKALELARGVKNLFIECQFLAEDKELAKNTAHLYSKEVASIIFDSKAYDFHLMHFSQRYLNKKNYVDFKEEVCSFLDKKEKRKEL